MTIITTSLRRRSKTPLVAVVVASLGCVAVLLGAVGWTGGPSTTSHNQLLLVVEAGRPPTPFGIAAAKKTSTSSFSSSTAKTTLAFVVPTVSSSNPPDCGGSSSVTPATRPTTSTIARTAVFQEKKKRRPRLSPEDFRLGYVDDKHDWKKTPLSPSSPVIMVPTLEQQQQQLKKVTTTSTTTPPIDSTTKDDEYDDATEIPTTTTTTTTTFFTYGANSQCYRGLTNPSKAALVLASMIAFGMLSSSPDIDMNMDIDSVITQITTTIEPYASSLSTSLAKMPNLQELTSSTTTTAFQLPSIHDLHLDKLQQAILPHQIMDMDGSHDMSQFLTSRQDSVVQSTNEVKDTLLEQSQALQQTVSSQLDVVDDSLKTIGHHVATQSVDFVDQSLQTLTKATQQFQIQTDQTLQDVTKQLSSFALDVQQTTTVQKNMLQTKLLDTTHEIRDVFHSWSMEVQDTTIQTLDQIQTMCKEALDHTRDVTMDVVQTTQNQLMEYSSETKEYATQTNHDLELLASQTYHDLELSAEQMYHDLEVSTQQIYHEMEQSTRQTYHDLELSASQTYHDLELSAQQTYHDLEVSTRAQLQDLEMTAKQTYRHLELSTRAKLQDLETTARQNYDVSSTVAKQWIVQQRDVIAEEAIHLQQTLSIWWSNVVTDIQQWSNTQRNMLSLEFQKDYDSASMIAQQWSTKSQDVLTTDIEILKQMIEHSMDQASQQYVTLLSNVESQSFSLWMDAQEWTTTTSQNVLETSRVEFDRTMSDITTMSNSIRDEMMLQLTQLNTLTQSKLDEYVNIIQQQSLAIQDEITTWAKNEQQTLSVQWSNFQDNCFDVANKAMVGAKVTLSDRLVQLATQIEALAEDIKA